MNSRNFPQVGSEFLRGTMPNSVVSGQTTKSHEGMERNTARGVKEAPVIKDITDCTYAPATDAPEVIPFRVYGEY